MPRRTATPWYTVTVTESDQILRCRWCGRELAPSTGPGRPREYCRRSHRQRAFEARRLGERMGLDRGDALVDADALEDLRDRLYVLESALDDVEHDLRGSPDPDEYRVAFRHLYAAAAQLRGRAVEPKALFSR